METNKLPCKDCGELILPRTAEKTGGVCMACQQGIRQSIEASKEYYRKQKEYDPHRELWLYLVKKVHDVEFGFDSLKENEKIYFSINLFEGEVYNGGMHQFFSNSSGEYYSEVVEGLTILKAENSLSLLKQAVKILFGEAEPPKDRILRWEAMREYPEDEDASQPDWGIELEKIDKQFWENPDKLGELLNDYAENTGLIEPFNKSNN